MKSLRTCVVLLLVVALQSAAVAAEPRMTPLDTYVHQPDPAFGWKVVKTVAGIQSTTSIIQLKSQGWRTEKDVDRTVWEHWLVVVKPERVTAKTAFLFVSGGANDRPMPEGADAMTAEISRSTGSIVAELRMVPNQPLVYHGDGKPRKEDDLIAYGWDQFIKTRDPTWIPQFAMVKSAVRAMDCLQEWSAADGPKLEKFVIAGASKRGWTTWLTGVTDRRVEALVPIVIDVVNVDPSMRHHAAAYGFWANAIGNYYEHGIMQRMNDPQLKELYRIVDPYSYRERLTMPKYIVNGSGDQFFLPDSSQFYFDELPGEKHLRYVPNADHSLKGSDALDSIIAFYQLILSGKPRPNLSWSFEKDGSIHVRTDTPAKQVLLWQATNPKTRDFRVMTIGKVFESRELTAAADGSFVGQIAAPATGWSAFFVEAAYDTGGFAPLKFSTAVRVLPDKLPFADLDPGKAPYEANVQGKRP